MAKFKVFIADRFDRSAVGVLIVTAKNSKKAETFARRMINPKFLWRKIFLVAECPDENPPRENPASETPPAETNPTQPGTDPA